MTQEQLKEIAERAAKAKECFMDAHPSVAIAARQYHSDVTKLLAHIHTLEEQNGRLREALVKAEADMVAADATANGRWSEWGDRATWVADKLDEAIEGVRAALAPPAPATREMEP